MIGIIDYGLGNVCAFANVYERLNIKAFICKEPSDIENVSKIILPGVGSFDHAVNMLGQSGMRSALDDIVLKKRVPVLGICVGMQLMAQSSEEGTLPGLGWIPGKVVKMNVEKLSFKTSLPHMGWNIVEPTVDIALFRNLENDPRFYFLHSYCFTCENNVNSIAEAEYGGRFTCAVNADNVYGVQFHPEKSHHNGVQVLKNFSEI